VQVRQAIDSTYPHPKTFRSLASKFFVFTGALIFWVVATMFGYDLRHDAFDVTKGVLMFLVVVLVAGAISRFTMRLLARPLMLLHAGITAVRKGRLEPIQVSRTGDEIEFLGDSFNRMISALAASQDEIRQHRELLERRIRERTEELEEALLRAQAASEAKSEFLANMSHELRTPMNGVLGMIDITLESRLAPEQREQLETAQQCAYSLLALLNDILDLSKIEAGKMALEKIPFNLRVMLDECVKSQLPRAARNRIAIYADVKPSAPEEIVGDPLRIRQIVANLLSNAVKFTAEGSVRVRMSAKTCGQDLLLEITVKDTGVGIPADKLPYIFDKFTQADGSVSRKYGGTGLGLAITRKLVEMHGGTIHVESEPGRGSAFHVALKCEVSAARPRRAPEPVSESPSAAPNTARILVVEDNAVNQKVVVTVLRKRGFTIEIASDGRDAIAKLKQAGPFDLVLMDVQMPVLDGLETTRAIRLEKRWRTLPIVAMTAHAMNGDRERCLEAGMNGYISKPVQAGHLLTVVDQYVRREVSAPALTSV
jgi:signal transduction histidine kinase/ActR/RegA family two-component response regulator